MPDLQHEPFPATHEPHRSLTSSPGQMVRRGNSSVQKDAQYQNPLYKRKGQATQCWKTSHSSCTPALPTRGCSAPPLHHQPAEIHSLHSPPLFKTPPGIPTSSSRCPKPRRGARGRSGPGGQAAPHTSVLMLRLRENASRMAESRLGLSACRLDTGRARSSWLTVL